MTFFAQSDLGWNVRGDLFLADPLFLLAIPGALLLWLFTRGRRPRAAVGVLDLEHPPRSLRQTLAFLPPLLHALGLVCLVVALARPLRASFSSTDVSEGVDILCVVDRSGSMRHEDLASNRSRLAVVKDVVAEFATRRMTDREGAADAVALLVFARYPELRCPQTLDVDALTGFLEEVEIVRRQEEDGTAIGVALAKGVSLLEGSEATSRVCVLLTDGENNVDDIAPLEAARLAADRGIRVYTILAGRYQYVQDVFGGVRAIESEIDTTELEEIAELTGARFYRARNQTQLEGIYAEIEQLERTERERLSSVETVELYLRWLVVGLAAYFLAWLSGVTWARRTVG